MCLIDKNKKSLSLEVLDRSVLELWSIIWWFGPKSLPPPGYRVKTLWIRVTSGSELKIFIDTFIWGHPAVCGWVAGMLHLLNHFHDIPPSGMHCSSIKTFLWLSYIISTTRWKSEMQYTFISLELAANKCQFLSNFLSKTVKCIFSSFLW